ncbi:iron complex transport system substrate-binding protein [Sporobacter termitidis DSM 10068]|uniref:Iron complex transport system substrate-binding protein n=1 Tax=Sporobacter termitidis DSM 10068 TaxID=1123282 RepID=A0A1M5VHR5_9FIRM|nr:ABC transporter substrate-binding protein [Sporobacter termitidis]SHH74761.1 iron complex transport system substrate-binding protein [Sporobacter termitidis DSM 10068]
MKKTAFVLLTLALLMSFYACGAQTPAPSGSNSPSAGTSSAQPASSPETPASHYPVTITTYNYAKQPIQETFDKAPEKVFAVYQDSIETLLALGLGDKIVACAGLDQDVKPEYADAFSKVNYLTEFSPDKESVVMMAPDFILSWYSYFSDKKLGEVDYWQGKGVNTYMMLNSGCAPQETLENEYTDILNLGKIFDVEEKAEVIVSEMKSEVSKVASEASKSAAKPSVLVMEFEDDGIRVYGENTLGGDMVKQLGANLVAAPDNHLSGEDLIAKNPDVIFTVYFGSSGSIADAGAATAKLLDDPKYASLSAVKSGKVYAISLGEVYCSGTRTLDGIQRLAKGIYPELYK